MESERSEIQAEWEKQKMVALYGALDKAGEALTQYIIPEITRVVDTVTGRTALVHKINPKFGVQVWIKERGNERENWSWGMITVRQPRLLKRYPRPFRWPREEPTNQCHCRIGKMEVEDVKENAVRCQRCKQLVGSESFPRRIERAENDLRKASRKLEILAKGVQVPKRVFRRSKRKASSKGKSSVKARKKSSSRVVVRRQRRANAKAGVSKTPSKRAAVSKKHNQKISKNTKVSKAKRARPAKASTSAKRAKVSR